LNIKLIKRGFYKKVGKNERGVAGQKPLEGGPATMRNDILKLFNLQGYGLIFPKLPIEF